MDERRASPANGDRVTRPRGWRWGARLLGMALLAGSVGLARHGQSADFACRAGDVACLITAIKTANTNGDVNCITLAAGIYTLLEVENDTEGPNGLPSIRSPLTLRGMGVDQTAIIRGGGTSPFRLLHVAATGSLTLEGLTLQGEPGEGPGGLLLNHGGTVKLAHGMLQGPAASQGGALRSGGTVTITPRGR